MRAIIQSHNSHLLEGEVNSKPEAKCNCIRSRKIDCPLPDECTTKGLIYEADVITKDNTMTYTGSTGNTFKKRWYSHMESFRNPNKRNSTELSRHIWSLKDQNTPYEIKWKINWKLNSNRKPNTKGLCILCNMERIAIANANSITSLNKRSELVGKCKHYRSLYFNSPVLDKDAPD